MKIQLQTEIELVIDNDVTLNITARKLTNKESKTFSKDIEKLMDTGKEFDKLKRKLKYVNSKNDLEPCIENIDEIYSLEEQISDYGSDIENKIADDIEGLYKRKLETIIGGGDAKKALKIAEDFGHMQLDTELTKAIADANKKGN